MYTHTHACNTVYIIHQLQYIIFMLYYAQCIYIYIYEYKKKIYIYIYMPVYIYIYYMYVRARVCVCIVPHQY